MKWELVFSQSGPGFGSWKDIKALAFFDADVMKLSYLADRSGPVPGSVRADGIPRFPSKNLRKFNEGHTAYEGCAIGAQLEKVVRFLDGTNSLLSPCARGDFWKNTPFSGAAHFQGRRFSSSHLKSAFSSD